jgi:tetratricopeptide (TPR) repeat protein
MIVIGLGLARFAFTEPTVDESASAPATPGELVASLEAKIAGNPEDLSAWQQLAGALLQEATETGDPSKYSRAQSALEKARVLDPGNQDTIVGLGVLALSTHNFDVAAETARELVDADPFNSRGLLVLVDAEIELGRYEEAVLHLQQLLDLRPALPALTRTSYIRELHGDLVGAEQAMIQALTAGSRSVFDRAVTTTLLGDLYLKQGEVERADQRYAEAQGTVPNLVTAGTGRARVAIAAGHLDVAADLLDEVVNRFPEPGAMSLLGEVLTAQGKAEEGERAFATVEVIADLQRAAGAVVDLELARFHADHGDPSQAVELAQSVYEIRPTIAAAEVLGWSLYQSGDAAAALPFARESLRLGTADAGLLLHAAAIAAANGESETANQLRSQASGLDPWFQVLHPELAADSG